jgi:hypothetical protein
MTAWWCVAQTVTQPVHDRGEGTPKIVWRERYATYRYHVHNLPMSIRDSIAGKRIVEAPFAV